MFLPVGVKRKGKKKAVSIVSFGELGAHQAPVPPVLSCSSKQTLTFYFMFNEQLFLPARVKRKGEKAVSMVSFGELGAHQAPVPPILSCSSKQTLISILYLVNIRD